MACMPDINLLVPCHTSKLKSSNASILAVFLPQCGQNLKDVLMSCFTSGMSASSLIMSGSLSLLTASSFHLFSSFSPNQTSSVASRASAAASISLASASVIATTPLGKSDSIYPIHQQSLSLYSNTVAGGAQSRVPYHPGL